MLTAEQQERYSRHLLLDGFDQDRLRAASFHVVGRTRAALWAARYLAASGCGRVVVDEPAWHAELRRVGPWTDLAGTAEKEINFFSTPGEGEGVEEAVRGAQAAVDAIRQVMAK
jgi:hypothetical protein